jgi:hypothetical protein
MIYDLIVDDIARMMAIVASVVFAFGVACGCLLMWLIR